MKLAWEILNVFAMYWMGFWWALYPFPCDVLAVYLLGTPALAPSDSALDIGVWTRETYRSSPNQAVLVGRPVVYVRPLESSSVPSSGTGSLGLEWP